MLVGQSNGTSDLNSGIFGVSNKAVSDLLNSRESGGTESDSSSLDLLVFENLLLVLVSH